MVRVTEANRKNNRIDDGGTRVEERGGNGNGIDTRRDDKVGERHDDVMSRRKRTLCRVAKGVIPYSVGSLIGKG